MGRRRENTCEQAAAARLGPKDGGRDQERETRSHTQSQRQIRRARLKDRDSSPERRQSRAGRPWALQAPGWVWAADGAEHGLRGGSGRGPRPSLEFINSCAGEGGRIPAGPSECGPHRCPTLLSICPAPSPQHCCPRPATRRPGTGAKEAAVCARGDREAGCGAGQGPEGCCRPGAFPVPRGEKGRGSCGGGWAGRPQPGGGVRESRKERGPQACRLGGPRSTGGGGEGVVGTGFLPW